MVVLGEVQRVQGGVGKWKAEGAELDNTDGSGSGEGDDTWLAGHGIGLVTPNPAYEARWPPC